MEKNKLRRWFNHFLGGRACAEHTQADGNHTVKLDALRVLICPDGEGLWFAQGIDLDYAAGGTSVDDVKRRFENGLLATIQAHLRRFGTIERLLKTPSPGVWMPLVCSAESHEFSIESIHELPPQFPFKKVEYIEGGRHAA